MECNNCWEVWSLVRYKIMVWQGGVSEVLVCDLGDYAKDLTHELCVNFYVKFMNMKDGAAWLWLIREGLSP